MKGLMASMTSMSNMFKKKSPRQLTSYERKREDAYTKREADVKERLATEGYFKGRDHYADALATNSELMGKCKRLNAAGLLKLD
jgi:hypothetical protein